MDFVGNDVYTVNGETNTLDRWSCIAEFNGLYHGYNERLCVLQDDKKTCVLPKRCVFSTKFEAYIVSKR